MKLNDYNIGVRVVEWSVNLQELADRDEPIKIKQNNYGFSFCPVCGHNEINNFCANCGQRLEY